MAAYYRAVSTYARHLAHVLRRGSADEPPDAASASVQSLLKDLDAARAQVDLLISAARVALPADQHPAADDARLWAMRLRNAVPFPREELMGPDRARTSLHGATRAVLKAGGRQ